MLPEFLTVKEVQHILKLGKDKTYKLVHTSGFPSIIVGGSIRVPKDAFEKWIKQYTYSEFKM